MRCSKCGAQVPDNLLLCPQCGAMVEETQPVLTQPVKSSPGAAASPTRWQRIRPFLLWGLCFLCLLILSLGVAVYGGLYQGERDRERRRQALAEQHYQAGLERLEAGEYELAIAEFEYVLKLDPDHPLAQQGIAEAEARIAARPTPVTPTPEQYKIVADDLYQQALVR